MREKNDLIKQIINSFATGFDKAWKAFCLEPTQAAWRTVRRGLCYLLQHISDWWCKKIVNSWATVVQFHKSMVLVILEVFTFKRCGHKYESLEGARFLPRNNLLLLGITLSRWRGKRWQGTKRWWKGPQQSRKQPQQFLREPEGAPRAHREGLHRLSSCWECIIVFPYWQLQHRADEVEKRPGQGHMGQRLSSYPHIAPKQVLFFSHLNLTFYSEQKIKLCGKYIYVYIHTHNRNCSNWVKDKVT